MIGPGLQAVISAFPHMCIMRDGRMVNELTLEELIADYKLFRTEAKSKAIALMAMEIAMFKNLTPEEGRQLLGLIAVEMKKV